VGNKIIPCHPKRVTWHSKMTWPMTWLPSGTPSGPVWPPIRPPSGPPLGTPSSTPSGTMIWSRRFGKRSSCPPLELPRPALPSGILSGTLVLSRVSGRPSISEPLNRCPFGPPTVALPYTYIKPSTPPLHHFLHSPICIGT
jgi:hypothetical protein